LGRKKRFNRRVLQSFLPSTKALQVARCFNSDFTFAPYSLKGFDNAGKSLFTTLREFVENSLDASEDVGILPTIEISMCSLFELLFTSREHVPALEVSDLYGEIKRV
jgi:DNA topoisomerase VI subunit B